LDQEQDREYGIATRRSLDFAGFVIDAFVVEVVVGVDADWMCSKEEKEEESAQLASEAKTMMRVLGKKQQRVSQSCCGSIRTLVDNDFAGVTGKFDNRIISFPC
jgi:hypothetical protein